MAAAEKEPAQAPVQIPASTPAPEPTPAKIELPVVDKVKEELKKHGISDESEVNRFKEVLS